MLPRFLLQPFRCSISQFACLSQYERRSGMCKEAEKRVAFRNGLCFIVRAMYYALSARRFRNQIARAGIFVLVCSLFGLLARASSLLPATTDRQIQMSAAIFRGTVLSTRSYEDPADCQIYTRTVLSVNEVFKGALDRKSVV